jgi:hypothetical protein
MICKLRVISHCFCEQGFARYALDMHVPEAREAAHITKVE